MYKAVCLLLLPLFLLSGCAPEKPEALPTVHVRRGDIRQAVPFQGELSTRRMALISVGVQGPAVLTELAAEGSRVKQGDIIARFDSAQLEQDLARQTHEVLRASQELTSLEKAELPLELLDLQAAYEDAVEQAGAEERFLESVRDLAARGLMSPQEVEQQERKVEALNGRLAQMANRVALTQEHIHGARLAKARATLATAEQQRDHTATQLALCTVTAPADGTVALLPLPVNGEYRTAHVGDTLFRNQAFMCIPDPEEYVLRGYIGEGELSHVQPGATVRADAPAFPGILLRGTVESVGAVAQTRPGEPAWKKFFPVLIALETPEQPLPAGLTTRAEIISASAADVLLLPRAALDGQGDAPRVQRMMADGRLEWVTVEPGIMGALDCEIRSGLNEGDAVILP